MSCNAAYQLILDRTQATLVLYLDAIDALLSGGVQEYKLDTGQTIQNVTKLDLDRLQAEVDVLLNRCATINARLNGGGTVVVAPSW